MATTLKSNDKVAVQKANGGLGNGNFNLNNTRK